MSRLATRRASGSGMPSSISSACRTRTFASNDAGRRIDESLNLGRLKATDGAFNYDIPAGVDLATIRTFVHDEANTSIPLSRTISFDPQHLHLPLRGENHGALPAYVVKGSSTLFGTGRLSLRALHIILSLCTIVLVYLMARRWRALVISLFPGNSKL